MYKKDRARNNFKEADSERNYEERILIVETASHVLA
jgi:hypothetical protein